MDLGLLAMKQGSKLEQLNYEVHALSDCLEAE